MRKVALRTVTNVSAGQGAPKQNEFSDSGIPFVRAGSLEDLLSGKKEADLELVPAETAKNRKLKLYPQGSILFAKSGMSATKDRIYVLQNPAYVVSHLAILTPKDNVHTEYLRLALKQFPPSILIKDPAYPAISLGEIQDYEIPMPEELDNQKRIAHLLGKVEGLIARRKQHLQKLGDLLKSAFLGMFGDIPAKRALFPLEKLRLYLRARSGKSSKSVLSETVTPFPIYGGNGVNGWALKPLYDRPVVVAGRVGQQCGIIHLTRGPSWVTDNAIAIEILDEEKLDPVYLATAFQYAPIREKVKQLDLPFINQTMLLDYPLPLPPIELQRQFATIVEKVEGIKSRYQQNLADLERLYGVLSQKEFKDELNLSRVPLPTESEKLTETEKSETEDSHPTKPQFGLPAPAGLATYLTPAGRKALLDQWLTAWLEHWKDSPFSVQPFMEASQQRLRELADDDAPEWGAAEYDELKAWVFEALETGRLNQTYDPIDNCVHIIAAKG